MPLQPGGPAPYTTAAMAMTALDAWRDRGFGTPVTPEILTRAGVTESLARRTFQSLVTLELLQADGAPTEQFLDFRNLRGDEEYRTRLQEWLRGVYADVLQYADPATDSYDRVTEAFRSYEPAGQRRSMASLLLGLWRYAGLPVASAANDAKPKNGTSRQPASRRAPKPRGKEKAATPGRGGSSATPAQQMPGAGELPPGLIGLLRQIPQPGKSWTSQRRDSFLQAFRAVLDFSVPVDDNPAPEIPDDDEETP